MAKSAWGQIRKWHPALGKGIAKAHTLRLALAQCYVGCFTHHVCPLGNNVAIINIGNTKRGAHSFSKSLLHCYNRYDGVTYNKLWGQQADGGSKATGEAGEGSGALF